MPSDTSPYAAVVEVVDGLLARLAAAGATDRAVAEAVEAALVPHLAVTYAGTYALGRENYREASPAQRDDYHAAFRRHLVRLLARMIRPHLGRRAAVDPRTSFEGRTATVRVTPEGAPGGGAVELRLRSRRPGQWLCIDAVVDGVSLLAALKEHCTRVRRDQGLDGLIALLHDEPGPTPRATGVNTV